MKGNPSRKERRGIRAAALLLALLFTLAGCTGRPRIQPISSLSPTRTVRPPDTPEPTPSPIPILPVDETATTIASRFNTRSGFTRESADPGSFEEYLRKLPLKAAGSAVLLHDGAEKADADFDAVIDWNVTDKNEQAAGAAARLFAEYHFVAGEMASIILTMNDGFKLAFSEWAQGKDIKTNSGGKLQYVSGGTSGETRENFDKYLAACNKWNSMKSLLSGDLASAPAEDPIRVGDVFAADGDVKYAVVVVDSAKDEAGNQQVMLVSGDKPAQQLRLWSNPLDTGISPWFIVDTLNGRIDTGREGITLSIESRYRFKGLD